MTDLLDSLTRTGAADAASLAVDAIKDYWTDQARTHGADPSASWTDVPMIELEIRTIGAHLRRGDRVLDVGCANGWSTIRYARDYGVRITGVDYVAGMIDQAHASLDADATAPRDRIEFAVGNALALNDRDGTYDTVVTTRMLINLGDWEHQQRALHELVRVTRPGGTLLLSEATRQGFSAMNAARAEWGLPAIPCKPFNVYLDEDRVRDELTPHATSLDVVDFSSSYFFGTRVLKPLLGAALGVEVPADSHWNRFFAALQSYGAVGTQRLFVVRLADDAT